MYRKAHVHTRQLTAGTFLLILLVVHIVKTLHTHHSAGIFTAGKQESIVERTGAVHGVCTICEFQLAKDAIFTGMAGFILAPVHTAPTYSRLLTAIDPDLFLNIKGRSPPQV